MMPIAEFDKQRMQDSSQKKNCNGYCCGYLDSGLWTKKGKKKAKWMIGLKHSISKWLSWKEEIYLLIT